MLTARIDALPPDSVKLLEIMACLGGKVELSLLQAAAAYSASEDVSVKFVSGVDR